MALPADYQTGTITGRWVDLDGTPMQGTVTFEAQVARMVSPGTNTIVVAIKKVATLSVAGEISLSLPATDDADITPQGFTYKVTESFNQGQSRSYHILVPHSTTTDLSDVVSVSANAGVTVTKGDPGPALDPKGSVANFAALPGSGNTVGDLYVTEDTHTFYAWNGSAWVDLGEIGPTDGSAATPSLRTLGTGATQAAAGSALASKEDAGTAADRTRQGLLSARGAASSSGRIYFATDEDGGTLYSDSGSVWSKAAPGVDEAGVGALASVRLTASGSSVTLAVQNQAYMLPGMTTPSFTMPSGLVTAQSSRFIAVLANETPSASETGYGLYYTVDAGTTWTLFAAAGEESWVGGFNWSGVRPAFGILPASPGATVQVAVGAVNNTTKSTRNVACVYSAALSFPVLVVFGA